MEHQVYVYLLQENVEVWRPVMAEHIGPDIYVLKGKVPEGETWEFQPGDAVKCILRSFEGEPHRRLVVVEKVTY